MKGKIFFILCLCFIQCNITLGMYNVTIKLTVDKFVGEVEQDVYLWHVVGNNYIIDDSIHILPSKSTYVLHATVLFESPVALLFSKRGPLRSLLIVNPGDNVTVNITKEDNKLGQFYKRAQISSAANESAVRLWERIDSLKEIQWDIERLCNNGGANTYQDSVSLYKKIEEINCKKISIIREVAETSPYPYVANTAQDLIKSDLPKNNYDAIANKNNERFSEYIYIKQLHLDSLNKTLDRMVSANNRRLIKQKESSRVKINAISLNQVSLPRIGNKISLDLRDSMGIISSTTDYRGKIVLIEVWASWCAPCIEAMPKIIELHKKYSKDFICLALTIDKDSVLWKKAIKKYKLSDLEHFKATDNNGYIFENLRNIINDGIIPKNYLLNREGLLVATDVYEAELEEKINILTKK